MPTACSRASVSATSPASRRRSRSRAGDAIAARGIADQLVASGAAIAEQRQPGALPRDQRAPARRNVGRRLGRDPRHVRGQRRAQLLGRQRHALPARGPRAPAPSPDTCRSPRRRAPRPARAWSRCCRRTLRWSPARRATGTAPSCRAPRQLLVIEKKRLRLAGWRRPSTWPSSWQAAHVYSDSGPVGDVVRAPARGCRRAARRDRRASSAPARRRRASPSTLPAGDEAERVAQSIGGDEAAARAAPPPPTDSRPPRRRAAAVRSAPVAISRLSLPAPTTANARRVGARGARQLDRRAPPARRG